MKTAIGGFNVVWLILVQAAVWNVLFPVYLLNMGLFVLALGVYFVALVVVANRFNVPRPAFDEYYALPQRIKEKSAKAQPKKGRAQPLLQSTLVQ